MATRDDYMNNDMFDPNEAVAAAVDKRNKVFAEKTLWKIKDVFQNNKSKKL